jgi:hypothetical protein
MFFDALVGAKLGIFVDVLVAVHALALLFWILSAWKNVQATRAVPVSRDWRQEKQH